MTDCSSIQGSTTSSSSDVMTLTTASSWCAIPPSSRIRVLRLIRPHSRRVLVAPDANASFGFAVRGGKEFGTGFFVSNIDRNSEADLKGLRVGDQILRINGFRIDDAVHKEFIQFVSSQDRITLKVRGVGMLPIKDREVDRVSWHVVKIPSISSTPSERSYKPEVEREARGKDINVVLNVAPRTKLGLGICKGPEWKPGIFVQFTKDKSVAREAGLRQGDQILTVNSVDFSDVLFSEAVAVMKGSNKLDMVVRTGAGCELFPGESSGYNSSASSITGDQSPCWGDPKSKRLTAVREETSTATTPGWSESFYEQYRKGSDISSIASSELNKTIIKLSENGTSINNTYIANSSPRKLPEPSSTSPLYMLTTPPVAPPRMDNTAIENSFQLINNGNHVLTPNDNKTVIVEVHRQAMAGQSPTVHGSFQLRRNNTHSSVCKAGEIGSPAISASDYHVPQSFVNHNINNKNNNQNKYQNCNTGTTGDTANGHNSHNNDNDHENSGVAGGSSLSNAIAEELKKRKEKQKIQRTDEFINNNNKNNFHQNNNCNIIMGNTNKSLSIINNNSNNNTNNGNNINNSNSNIIQPVQTNQFDYPATMLRQQVSRRASTANSSTAPITNSYGELESNTNGTVGNSNNNGNTSANNAVAVGVSVGRRSSASNGDQHSALMDEFKRAHQRMFKKGFHETEHQVNGGTSVNGEFSERQEALKRTTMMEDETSYRTSRVIPTDLRIPNEKQLLNGSKSEIVQNGVIVPPPPPEFANTSIQKTNIPKSAQKVTNHQSQNPPSSRLPLSVVDREKPPNSPIPDYDNVDMRPHLQSTASTSTTTRIHTQSYYQHPLNGRSVQEATSPSSRRPLTMRLGAVTIGEYDSSNRKPPAKLDFVATSHGSTTKLGSGSSMKNLHTELQSTLSRSNLKKPNVYQNAPMEHQSHCPLQTTYTNLDNSSRKISPNDNNSINRNTKSTILPNPPIVNGNSTGNGNGNGILKNGNRHRSGSLTKNPEKSIKFGN